MVLLTGPPGIGKTTAILKAVEMLKSKKKISVGGMITKEVRENKSRVGFQIIDLSSGATGWLAHVNQPKGPKIGKYRVNLKDLEGIGVKALLNALENSDLIVCDEIGPMELTSKKFREAVAKLASSGKAVLGSIHYKLSDNLIDEVKCTKKLKVIKITFSNRDYVPYVLYKELMHSF